MFACERLWMICIDTIVDNTPRLSRQRMQKVALLLGANLHMVAAMKATFFEFLQSYLMCLEKKVRVSAGGYKCSQNRARRKHNLAWRLRAAFKGRLAPSGTTRKPPSPDKESEMPACRRGHYSPRAKTSPFSKAPFVVTS